MPLTCKPLPQEHTLEATVYEIARHMFLLRPNHTGWASSHVCGSTSRKESRRYACQLDIGRRYAGRSMVDKCLPLTGLERKHTPLWVCLFKPKCDDLLPVSGNPGVDLARVYHPEQYVNKACFILVSELW